MRASRPLLLILAALTAGCADPEPFVDDGGGTSLLVSKPVDPVIKTGSLPICYSETTPWSEIFALATERCSAHGLAVHPQATIQRWQCRVTSPHKATFYCYDPEMIHTNGLFVNPFNRSDVARWEGETGKTAKPHNFLTTPGAQAPAGESQPAPAGGSAAVPPGMPAAPAAPPSAALTPADLAGKPPVPTQSYRLDAPPPVPPAAPIPNDPGFTLPQGSWGDHFQE
jgi:hypothetical protein